MKISARQYAQSLYDLVKDENETRVTELLHNFVILLNRHRNLNLAPAISEAFVEIWNLASGEISAELTSAREFNAEAKEAVLNYLIKKSGAKQALIEEKIDKKVLGGFVLKYNNKIVDASLRNSLSELKGEMRG